jgi:predicted nucleic acid-binding Zn ribbon protein
MAEKSVGELLDLLLAKLKCDPSDQVGTMVRDWIGIVGADAAVHSRIVDIRNGTLIVGVDHPAWASIVTMRKRNMLTAISKKFPDLAIKRIEVRTTAHT